MDSVETLLKAEPVWLRQHLASTARPPQEPVPLAQNVLSLPFPFPDQPPSAQYGAPIFRACEATSSKPSCPQGMAEKALLFELEDCSARQCASERKRVAELLGQSPVAENGQGSPFAEPALLNACAAQSPAPPELLDDD